MSDKNSWEYKNSFECYASNVDDESYDWSCLLELVEDKLNNEMHGTPLAECFPMTVGAGDPDTDGCGELGARIANMLAEEYLENYGHPVDSEYSGKFWNDLAGYDVSNMWADHLDGKTNYDKNEAEVLRLLVALKTTLSKIPCLRLEVEEIEVTLDEIQKHAPELLKEPTPEDFK